MIDLSGKSDAMNPKLFQQIIKVEPSAETNRPEDIAGFSKKKWPKVKNVSNRKRNQSVVSIDLTDSDGEIEVKQVTFNYYLPKNKYQFN